MDTKIKLNDALKALSKLQINLEQQGGPEENGELFEQILEIQDGIIRKFGLPTNHPACEKLLYFKTPPTDYEILNRIKQLHELAVIYLSSDALTDMKLLTEAQNKQLDVFYVLPVLSIPTHIYTIFVYNEILLKRKDLIENIIHELRFVYQFGLLNILGKLELGYLTDETEIVELLEQFGLKYIQQFLFFIKSKRK